MDERNEKLYKKLKALAEQGVGGEAENAKAFLEEFIKNHPEFKNYDDTVFDGIRELTCFKFDPKDPFSQRILNQIIAHELGISAIENMKYRFSGTKRRKLVKNEVWVEASKEEYLRIVFLHEFYLKRWNDKLKTFFSAFIQKNNLAVDSNPNAKKLSEQELRDLFRMMNGIDADIPDEQTRPMIKDTDRKLLVD